MADFLSDIHHLVRDFFANIEFHMPEWSGMLYFRQSSISFTNSCMHSTKGCVSL